MTGQTRPWTRNRVGSFVGAALVGLVVAAVLLASRDMMKVQARAVAGLLDQAGVRHELIVEDDILSTTRVGASSRDGRERTAAAPLITVDTPAAGEPNPARAAAVIALAVLACVAMAASRRIPAPLKGAVLLVAVIGALSAAYSAWIDPLPPLDIRTIAIDWRQVPLVPMVVVALLFWYDLYPMPGSFLLKTAWVGLAQVAVVAFSVVRLATVIAAYSTFGPSAFLAGHQLAGVFLDLVPGMAVLALAHASVEWTSRMGPRFAWWAR